MVGRIDSVTWLALPMQLPSSSRLPRLRRLSSLGLKLAAYVRDHVAYSRRAYGIGVGERDPRRVKPSVTFKLRHYSVVERAAGREPPAGPKHARPLTEPTLGMPSAKHIGSAG
jgi:hypothetical protein